ncbi:MAG: WG repeat-containing protein [Kaistella sp.]|nr:WG repeat-containing protein [Kaistella sp.]
MKKLLTLCLLLAVLLLVKAQDLIPFEAKGYMGFKNNAGEVVIEARYKYPDDFYDGLLLTSIDKKYGYVDISGKTVIPFLYKGATDFYKGFAVIEIDNTVLIIDKTGKEVKKLKYTAIGFSADDVANVKLDGKYGTIVKNTGQELVPPTYELMSRFNDHLSRPVKLGNKWGIITKAGRVLVPLEYDEIINIKNHTYQVKLGEKYGVVNVDSKLTPEMKYDEIGYATRAGIVSVKAAGKYGFIDQSGVEIIPLKYNYASDFQGGFATVRREARWYFVNDRGEELPVVYNGTENYQYVSELLNGFANVKLNNKHGFIDKNRKLVVPVIYEDTGYYYGGLVDVKLKGKWGLLDESGDIILPLEYDEVDFHDVETNIKAVKDGKDFYFDHTGKPVSKP